MNVARWLWLSGFLFACGSTAVAVDPDGGNSNKDGGQDASGDSGSQCCAPDPSPGCCMAYGGWGSGLSCGKICDGMPQPGDPGWKLIKDDHNCLVWNNPKPNGGPGSCGAPTFDAGKDAPTD